MKRMLLTALALLLCATSAQASPSLSAQMRDGALHVAWTGCACSAATLSLYQNDWPVLVVRVCGADGYYTIPAACMQGAGRYAVRLNCADGCVKTDVRIDAATAAPTGVPSTAPTQRPTEVPSTAPTQRPTEIPTAAPTQRPTEIPTAALTQRPTEIPTAAPTQRPTEVPTAAPEQQTGTSLSALAEEVVRQVNEERAARGLGTLTLDAELTRAACVRAREIVESFSHTRPDGSNWSSVSSAVSGENIAKGQKTADRVMAAWMSSEGHRANILRTSFTRIGVCAYQAGNVVYWAQLFGR